MVRGELANAARFLQPVFENNPSAATVLFFYSVTLFGLGDFDSLREIRSPIVQIYADTWTGEFQSAGEQLPGLISALGIDNAIEIAAFYYLVANDLNSMVDMVDTHYGSVDQLLEQKPQTTDVDLGYMPYLAWAYLQLGRQEDYDKVVAAMRNALEEFGSETSVMAPVITSNADFAAVTGDVDRLLQAAQKLVDHDTANVEPFALPFYQQYFELDEFRRMNDYIVARADEERAKLGLGPYASQFGGGL